MGFLLYYATRYSVTVPERLARTPKICLYLYIYKYIYKYRSILGYVNSFLRTATLQQVQHILTPHEKTHGNEIMGNWGK